MGGNALVEGGTNLAILLGTLAAGVLIGVQGGFSVGPVHVPLDGPVLVALGCVGVALAGYQAARLVPLTPSAEPDLKVQWNPIPPTLEIYRFTTENRAVFLSILGISWFWLFGQGFLALFADYGRNSLYAGEHVVTLFLALFSVGVGVGSILCDKLSFERLELGLVPFGSLGMTVFAFDLFLVGCPFPAPAPGQELLAPGQLLSTFQGVRIAVDLFLLALCSGFYIVPLYTLIQKWTAPSHRSRVIAGNNILNAFFMVGSAGFLMFLVEKGLTIPQVFGVLAVLNGLVALYIYTLLPDFFLRFVAYLMAHGVYRLKVEGLERVPRDGPVILACNHVSFADWMVIAASIARPIRFVMWHAYAEIPVLRFLMKDARVIPIGSARHNPELVEGAFRQVREGLAQGDVVCIFPEGRITSDGELTPFRAGVEKMARESGEPVLPLALRGFWGSLFSRRPGRFWRRFLRPLRSKVELVVGHLIPAEEVSVDRVKAEVAALRGTVR